jgi:hypothetical protein
MRLEILGAFYESFVPYRARKRVVLVYLANPNNFEKNAQRLFVYEMPFASSIKDIGSIHFVWAVCRMCICPKLSKNC